MDKLYAAIVKYSCNILDNVRTFDTEECILFYEVHRRKTRKEIEV